MPATTTDPSSKRARWSTTIVCWAVIRPTGYGATHRGPRMVTFRAIFTTQREISVKVGMKAADATSEGVRLCPPADHCRIRPLGRGRESMDHYAEGVTNTGDWALVGAARAGDRLAFGLLYLRHSAAAWRGACVASPVPPHAELAVIEGFTRIFSALPEESEAFSPGDLSFRPYVLACVRQSALDRARAARRSATGSEPSGALAGLGPDGEIVLCTL